MKLLILGGTGFIGNALINFLKDTNTITVVTRDTNKAKNILPGILAINWEHDGLIKALTDCEVVINLVGENIGEKRWSSARREKIIKSRTQTTQKICDICMSLPKESRPRIFNASAIGLYGLSPDKNNQMSCIYDENSLPPKKSTDFLSHVGKAWEDPLNKNQDLDIVRLRFAVVLNPEGGMIKKITLPFKLGLGGPIGSGNQPFSWIALEDLIEIINYLLIHPELSGPFNLVAPQVVTQKQFAQSFAKYLKRPCFIPMPSLVVKMLFGQMGDELLLQGQNVTSIKLGSELFKYSSLEKLFLKWHEK
ncbi:MAG: TIGR01777 family oxidoreductase [Legionellaceae bacterium]|nr:TIGR01777 family oxidoreductase [Legionellaceae bacterium]